MQTVPGLVLCEKSEGTLIVFQQDAAGAQDIAHGGVIQIQLQQGADALQPVHQRIAVDEKLPGRGMEVLLLQQVDAQGVQQGGAVGLVVLLQAAQHGVDEGPEVGALGDGADKHVLIQGRGAAAARTAVQVPGGGASSAGKRCSFFCMALCWAGSQNRSSCKKRSSGAARQAVGAACTR